MSRSSRARVERRRAHRAAGGRAGACYLVTGPLSPVPSWARFGEPLGPEHEVTHAAILEALTLRCPAPGELIVGVEQEGEILIGYEEIEPFAEALAASGHHDVAAAIRRPVQSGMVRTLAVSRCESFQTAAVFWPDRAVNACTRGSA
ncbi:hypothetical protein [Sorangium sp. So ce693]|uniref:hypothetical protein n=1 Tax=Sorangium sp. So ce693 TaxID=3133318 RepID=UPI003F61C766